MRTPKLFKRIKAASVITLALVLILAAITAFSLGLNLARDEAPVAHATIIEGGSQHPSNNTYEYRIDGGDYYNQSMVFPNIGTRFYITTNKMGSTTMAYNEIGGTGNSNDGYIRAVTLVELTDANMINAVRSARFSINFKLINHGSSPNESDQIRMRIESSNSKYTAHNEGSGGDWSMVIEKKAVNDSTYSQTYTASTMANLYGKYLRLSVEIYGHYQVNMSTFNYSLCFYPYPTTLAPTTGNNNDGHRQGGNTAWPTAVNAPGETNLAVGTVTKSNPGTARWTVGATAAGDGDHDYGANYGSGWGDGVTRNSGATREGEIIMDQGGSGQNRRLVAWLTVPIGSNLAAGIASGSVRMTFSAAVGNRMLDDATIGISITWGYGGQSERDFTALHGETSNLINGKAAYWNNLSVTINKAVSGVTAVRVVVWEIRGGASVGDTELFAKDMKLTTQYYPSVNAYAYGDGAIRNDTVYGSVKIDSGAAGSSAIGTGKTIGSSYTLTATPSSGYYFSHWRKNSGSGTGDNYGSKTRTYSVLQADAFTSPIYWDAYFCTITTPATTTVTFNGSPQGVAAPTGLPSGYTYTITYNGSATVPTNAGTYPTVVNIFSNTGENVGSKNVTLIINKKDITITAASGQSKYYGEADPTLTYSAPGVIASVPLVGALARNAGEGAGSYTISQGTLTNANNPNYNITSFTGSTFTINKTTPVKVSETAPDIHYGQLLSASNLSVSYKNPHNNAAVAGTVSWNTPNAFLNANTYTQGYGFTPSDTGNYNAVSENIQVIVHKVTPTFPQAGTINVKYGQSLTAAAMPGAINPYNTALEVLGTYNWQSPSAIPALNGSDVTTTRHYYNFVPTGQNADNYNAVTDIPADVTARLSTSIAKIAMGAGANTNIFEYDWDTTKVVDGKARIGLKAIPNAAQNYVFLGWRKNGTYITVNGTYVYQMASETQAETDAEFVAVFAQYLLNGQLVNEVNEYYNGTARRVEVSVDLFSQNPSLYKIGLDMISGSEPIGLGSFRVSFMITNTELGIPVFSPEIDFNVLEAEVSAVVDVANSDGYNSETGWANSVAYRLSVTGTAPGAVQKYIYSTDNGETWHDVPGTPANLLNCPIIFYAAASSEGQSYTTAYRFKAVHTSYGLGAQKSVASSAYTYLCKIDTVAPQLNVSFANGYNGEWTNQDVTFNASAFGGGSGMLILYSTDGGNNWHDTGLTSYNVGTGTGTIDYNGLSFSVGTQQNLEYIFRAQTGTGRVYDMPGSLRVRIDTIAPAISKVAINRTPNENGWIKDTATVIYTVSDMVGNISGVESIYVDNGADYVINDGGPIKTNINDLFVYVSDYKSYTIYAYDIAGNVATLEVREKVDTKAPEFTTSGYTADEWINGTAQINFNISAGASGVKVLYSTDGGNTFTYWTEGDYLTDGEEAYQTVSVSYTVSGEQSKAYVFAVENGAGLVTAVPFGNINIDQTAPLIIDNDPEWSITLAQYQGESPWVSDDVIMKFIARDGHAQFNSGIDHAKVSVTNVGEYVEATHSENGKYSFIVNKCTEYLVSVTDVAGNVTTKTYTLKVDQGEPSFTAEAYIGETGEEYTFNENLWLSHARYGDDAFVRFIFHMTFTPSGAKMQYSLDGKDGSDPTKIWFDLTPVLFEEGRENEFEQHVTIQVDIKNQQNNPYMVRIISGSGRVMEGQNQGRIRIDFNPPVFETAVTYYYDGVTQTNYGDVTGKWGYRNVEARFIPGDSPSGVAGVEVRRYEVTQDHTDPDEPYTVVASGTQAELFSFMMDRYAKYVIVMWDRAENVFVNDPIIPKIDKTDGFSFTVDTNGYVSGTWIDDNAVNVRFDFNITFDSASGFTGFGPSGGAIEFTNNDGGQWLTQTNVADTLQAVQDNGTLNPYMIAAVSQIRTYKFRLITGAGRVYYDNGSYTVNKDTILPAVTAAPFVNGEPYAGVWTYENVDFRLNMVIGPSRAQYYWASSVLPSVTSESELAWNLIGSLNESANAERTYTVNSTTDRLYYYFRIVSYSGKSDFTAAGTLVKIDKATVTANTTAYHNAVLYTGSWVNGSVDITVRNVASGPSGYTVEYQTRRIGSDVFGDYLSEGYDAVNNVLTLSSNTQNEYRLRITSGAGREYTTGIIAVKIDNEIPEFNLISDGERLAAPSQNAGWWVSEITVIYNVTHTGESGYTLQYAVSGDGTSWSDWTSDGIASLTLIIGDESDYGGTVKHYRMRVMSGSGVSSAVNNYGEVKIDTNTYTISATQLVSSTPGSYAVITNIISDYARGERVDSAVNMLSGYFIKSLIVKSGNTVVKSETPANRNTSSSSFSLEISGENVTVELSCYKQISITYNNRSQYLQNRNITPAVITVDEPGFNATYGALNFNITYNGSSAVPQEIGVYILEATIADDSFILVNPSETNRTMTVVYFSGNGVIDGEPYLITSLKDLRYVDYYMSTDGAYDFLGANRRSAAFKQTKDLELTSDFIPVGKSAGTAFAGLYDGGNFKVYYRDTYTVFGRFGFFDTLTYGAKVRNLGVEYNLEVSGSGYSAGLLAGEAYSAEITGSYAIGSITAAGTSANVGGIVGMAWNSLLGGNFADVAITTRDISGNVGGLIGLFETTANYLNFYSNFAVSTVSVTGMRREVSAGSMLGLVSGNLNYKDGTTAYLNVYNMSNLTVYREPLEEQGFANQSVWPETGVEARIYEIFRGDESIIGSASYPGAAQRTVAALAARRAADMGIAGSGTNSDPYIIDTKAKLAALEVFPYASFRQTANIIISAFRTLNLDIAFTGEYDGGLYSLVAPVITANDSYGGFFGILKGTVQNIRLVDIVFDFSSYESEAYYGGLAAFVREGSSISNVIVSGSMTVYNGGLKGRVYAGGIAGVLKSSDIADAISLVNLNIVNSYTSVVGGIAGQVEGESTLNNLVSLARITVNYSGSGFIGSSVGSVHGTSPVTGKGIYNISGNTYANGRVFESSIGVPGDASELTSISAVDYQNAVSAASGILVSGSDILSLITSLYPFSGGAGTYDNPFIISNYEELLRIGDYMYAYFELADDITIGDYDGDGETDAGYSYDFNTIGRGAVFTGTLDGKQHSIYGLTDSLFEINAGQVKNVTLNVYYAAYGAGNPALLSDPRAKAISGNGDVVFGAVAKYNRAGGDVRSVIVNGEINVQNPGRGRVKVGGIIGIATGGSILGSISYVNTAVKSVTADIGGIVGSVDGNIKIQDSIMLAYNIVVLEKITAHGSVINAGLVAGAVRTANAEIDIENLPSNSKVLVNGKQIPSGSDFIGLNPYN